MLNLASATSKLTLTTAAATAVHVHASWVDLNTSTSAVTPGALNSIISSVGTTDIVPSPASGTVRNVKTLRIDTVGGAQTVVLRHTDGTNAVELHDPSLAQDEYLSYDEGVGFNVYDTTGAIKTTLSAPGRFIKSTVYTTGSGNHTTDAKCSTIFLRMVGGGGGGGGCSSVAGAASAAGGGGSGGYLEKTVAVQPSTAYAYSCGALGAGNSGAAGGNGGNSTFVVGGTTYTANGGTGAPLATASSAVTAYAGGAGGAASTNGDLNAAGQPGAGGVCVLVATPVVSSGAGGSSMLGGRGGVGLTAVGAGVAGVGPGAGGGGAATGASTARAGGAGIAGAIIVDEYT
jgi:hypothetical protein